MVKNKLYTLFLIVLISNFAWNQQGYNSCNQALKLCPNKSFSFSNIGANKTFCTDCEDDFNFCFTPENTIWIKFYTNKTGGNGTIQISNLIFEVNNGHDNDLNAVLIEAKQPCIANSYTQIGNCYLNQTANFNLSYTGLLASTTYFLVLSGDKNGAGVIKAAEFSGEITVSGSGIDLPTPTMSLYTDSTHICKGQVVSFYASVTNCPDSTAYHWFINDSLVTITDTNYFQTSAIDSGDVVSVSSTCYTQCIVTINDSTNAFFIDPFTVDAGKDRTIDKGMTVQLNGQGTAATYEWQPQNLVTNPTIATPVAFPNQTTTFTLKGSLNGCDQFDYITISIESNLIIPESFSPNNDGINDVFEIVGIEQYPNCFIRIFDRWGEEVFQKIAYSYENAWDGRLLGKVNPGVYYYVLELRDSENQVKKGNITVLK